MGTSPLCDQMKPAHQYANAMSAGRSNLVGDETRLSCGIDRRRRSCPDGREKLPTCPATAPSRSRWCRSADVAAGHRSRPDYPRAPRPIAGSRRATCRPGRDRSSRRHPRHGRRFRGRCCAPASRIRMLASSSPRQLWTNDHGDVDRRQPRAIVDRSGQGFSLGEAVLEPVVVRQSLPNIGRNFSRTSIPWRIRS